MEMEVAVLSRKESFFKRLPRRWSCDRFDENEDEAPEHTRGKLVSSQLVVVVGRWKLKPKSRIIFPPTGRHALQRVGC